MRIESPSLGIAIMLLSENPLSAALAAKGRTQPRRIVAPNAAAQDRADARSAPLRSELAYFFPS